MNNNNKTRQEQLKQKWLKNNKQINLRSIHILQYITLLLSTLMRNIWEIFLFITIKSDLISFSVNEITLQEVIVD